WRVYSKMQDIQNPGPSRSWVFMDEREDKVNYGNAYVDMRGYPSTPGALQFHFDYPGNYHNRACGFSFADGHAEIKKWLDGRTTPPIVKDGVWNAAPIVASPNNVDIMWW